MGCISSRPSATVGEPAYIHPSTIPSPVTYAATQPDCVLNVSTTPTETKINELHEVVSLASNSPDEAYVKIDEILQKDVEIDKIDQGTGETALHTACRLGVEAIVDQLILNGGASLKIKSRDCGDTPLHAACSEGHVNVVRSLLRSGANLEERNYDDKTPLFVAVEAVCDGKPGSQETVAILLEHKANMDAHSKILDGMAPVHLMAANKLTYLLQEAIYYQASSSENTVPSFLLQTDTNQNTVMHYAVESNAEDIVGLLLNIAPSLLPKRNKNGDSALGIATKKGFGHLVCMMSRSSLLTSCSAGDMIGVALALEQPEVGENLEIIVDSKGNTAVHLAAMDDQVEILDRLHLRASNSVLNCLNIWNSEGDTPLFASIRRNRRNAVAWILAIKPTLQAQRDPSLNNSPMHVAALSGAVDVMHLLLTSGDINAKNSLLQTPLHLAAAAGQASIVSLIINIDVDIMCIDSDGYTPIELAQQHSNEDVLQLLLHKCLANGIENGNNEDIYAALAHGAKVNWQPPGEGVVKDNAIHLASKSNNHSALSDVLLNAPGAIDACCMFDDIGDPPLHSAARNGNVEAIESLLSRPFVDKELTNADGDSAMTVAAKEGWAQCIEALVHGGANVNFKAEFTESTPLHEAVLKSQVDAVRTLLKYKANPNSMTLDGNTPAHMLMMWGTDGVETGEILQALADANADLNARNLAGQTPLEITTSYNRTSLMDAVLSVGSKTSSAQTIEMPNSNLNSTEAMDSGPDPNASLLTVPSAPEETLLRHFGSRDFPQISGPYVSSFQSGEQLTPIAEEKKETEKWHKTAASNDKSNPIASSVETHAVSIAMPFVRFIEKSMDSKKISEQVSNPGRGTRNISNSPGTSLRTVRLAAKAVPPSPFMPSGSVNDVSQNREDSRDENKNSESETGIHKEAQGTDDAYFSNGSNKLEVNASSESKRISNMGSNLSTDLDDYLEIGDDQLLVEESNPLGRGSYGQVYRGIYHGMKVAIKVPLLEWQKEKRALNQAAASNEDEKAMKNFQREIMLMKKLQHRNVQRLFGYAYIPGKGLAIVSQFYSRRSLVDVLRRGLTNPDRAAELHWGRRLQFALDISCGMNFLHSRSPAVLHRDLKAMNCFIDKDWCALVGDFGMSKEIRMANSFASASSVGLQNPRWMAPEIIQNDAYGAATECSEIPYTRASDVFAFGMLLYEILTWVVPWKRARDVFEIRVNVLQGKRPEIPSIARIPGVAEDNNGFIESGGYENFINLMKSCWDQDPNKRPSFGMVYARIGMMLEEEMERRGTPLNDDD